jgi:hypothetical protein
MKVAIITTKSGVIEVHAAGCADVAKSAKRNRDDAWILDADSLVEVSEEYWSDVISDTVDPDSAEGKDLARQYATTEFNCLPCAKDLPFEDEAEATPAPASAVTTWIGKQVAEEVLSQLEGTTVAAKVAEAKVTKAGDRTLKLDANEAAQLRALATELEALGGSLAYSARTLRARLS